MAALMEIFKEGYSNTDEERLSAILQFLGLSIEHNDFIIAAHNNYLQNTATSLPVSGYITNAFNIIQQEDKSAEKKFIELVQFFTYGNIASSLNSTLQIELQKKIVEHVDTLIVFALQTHENLLDLRHLGLAILNSKLSNLKQLEFLFLSNNSISDITVLSGLRNLKDLDLGFNNIKSIAPLAEIVSLTKLYLTNNSITDVGPLKKATHLKALFLANNNITTNVDVLATLTALEDLDLRYNLLNEEYLPRILALPNLIRIYLMGTGIGIPKHLIDIGNPKEIIKFYSPDISEQVNSIIENPLAENENFDLPPEPLPPPPRKPDFSSESAAETVAVAKENKTAAANEEETGANTLIHPMRSFSLFSKPGKSLFDVDKLTEIFRDLIVNSEKSEEQFFGLFGRWGRGKTFFWNLLKEKIGKENKGYHPIEFHAWKYQDTPAVWAYLYDAIAKEYYNKPATWFSISKWIGYAYRVVRLNYVRENLLSTLFSLIIKVGFSFLIYLFSKTFIPATNGAEYNKIIGIVLATPLSAYAIYDFFNKQAKTDAQQILQKLTKKINFESHLGIQHEIQKELAALLISWIPEKNEGKERILLFVDDIDRCSEVKIIQIVDYIRVLLHHPDIEKRMTVVAAIDERILIHAIKNKYNSFIVSEVKKMDAIEGKQPASRDEKIKQQLCREYIDKLFIASLKLGPLTDFERTEIVDGFTAQLTRARVMTETTTVTEPTATGNNDAENLTAPVVDVSNNNINGNRPVRRGKAIDNITLAAFPETAATVTTVPPAGDTGKTADTEDKTFMIDADEQDFLKELLTRYATDATPRSIRVYILRYLLGKRLIEKPLRENNLSYRQWHNSITGKKYFAMMLLKYTFDDNNNTETLESDYADFLKQFSGQYAADKAAQADQSKDYKNKVFEQEFSIRPVLSSIIYQVLSMVVAY